MFIPGRIAVFFQVLYYYRRWCSIRWINIYWRHFGISPLLNSYMKSYRAENPSVNGWVFCFFCNNGWSDPMEPRHPLYRQYYSSTPHRLQTKLSLWGEVYCFGGLHSGYWRGGTPPRLDFNFPGSRTSTVGFKSFSSLIIFFSSCFIFFFLSRG